MASPSFLCPALKTRPPPPYQLPVRLQALVAVQHVVDPPAVSLQRDLPPLLTAAGTLALTGRKHQVLFSRVLVLHHSEGDTQGGDGGRRGRIGRMTLSKRGKRKARREGTTQEKLHGSWCENVTLWWDFNSSDGNLNRLRRNASVRTSSQNQICSTRLQIKRLALTR